LHSVEPPFVVSMVQGSPTSFVGPSTGGVGSDAAEDGDVSSVEPAGGGGDEEDAGGGVVGAGRRGGFHHPPVSGCSVEPAGSSGVS
jgi:hypothetical protein